VSLRLAKLLRAAHAKPPVLVTGGTGHYGRWITASLTRRGWLEKDAGGNLYVAAEAAAAFADFNYGRVGDLLDVAHAIDALIADHPPAGRRRPEGSRTRPTPGPASR